MKGTSSQMYIGSILFFCFSLRFAISDSQRLFSLSAWLLSARVTGQSDVFFSEGRYDVNREAHASVMEVLDGI